MQTKIGLITAVVILTVCAVFSPHALAADGFEDVPQGAVYENALRWATERGIVKGTDATHFSPNRGCTRGEFCTMLWRLHGKPAVTPVMRESNPFADVIPGKGHGNGILWCYQQKIITGTVRADGVRVFRPAGKLSRTNIIVMLYKTARAERGRAAVAVNGGGASPYKDIPADDRNISAYRWAYRYKISAPSDGRFQPKADCRRWQLVTFLYRLDQAYPDTEPEPEPEPESEPVKWTVTYELNGGSNPTDAPAEYEEGTGCELPVPVRENHVFRGWYLDEGFAEKAETIAADASGDIKLYAKWHLEALNRNGEGTDDMVWSPGSYPQVLTHGDWVFWGYATSGGYSGVAASQQGSTEVVRTDLKRAEAASDKNSPAIAFLPDGRILTAFAGGYDSDRNLYIRVSDSSYDSTEFTLETVLDCAGTTAYSQLLYVGGRYHLFYRLDGRNWAERSSTDGENWTEERILITAETPMLCLFRPTDQAGLLRVCLCEDYAAGTAVRTGFYDAKTGWLLDADAVTVLGAGQAAAADFAVLTEGRALQLFDVAVSEKTLPRVLYAAGGVYYLYDGEKNAELCRSDAPLSADATQNGAVFFGRYSAVAARGIGGADLIERYDISDGISLAETIVSAPNTGNQRSARPIADAAGTALLWNSGSYDPGKEQSFMTEAKLCFEKEGLQSSIEKDCRMIQSYANRLYAENVMEDYTKGGFTWDQQKFQRGWLYYNGYMMEAFVTYDMSAYLPEVRRYYDQHITQSGVISGYGSGALDSAMGAAAMVDLVMSGMLTPEEETRYTEAIQFAYRKLEQQTTYSQVGNLYQHSEKDGAPTAAWARWNIALDGIYMSQVFLVKLATAIDSGKLSITGQNGTPVQSASLWNDTYTRCTFVMEHMRDPETGLLYHGYCVKEERTNGAFWSRGIGWFAMALMEAADKMPDPERKMVLKRYFNELMEAVLGFRDPISGIWYNVPDGREEVTDNRPETSGTTMFAYCLLRGYRSGLLEGERFYQEGLQVLHAVVSGYLWRQGLTETMLSSGVTSNRDRYAINGYAVNEAKGIAGLIMAAAYVN